MKTETQTTKGQSASQNRAEWIPQARSAIEQGQSLNDFVAHSHPDNRKNARKAYLAVKNVIEASVEPESAQPRKENAATHSPLPWRAQQSRYADMPDVPCSDWTVTAPNEQLAICFTRNEANAKLIVASVNHAGALAEALREPLAQAKRALSGDSNDEEHDALFHFVETADAALKQWEKSSQ